MTHLVTHIGDITSMKREIYFHKNCGVRNLRTEAIQSDMRRKLCVIIPLLGVNYAGQPLQRMTLYKSYTIAKIFKDRNRIKIK